MKLIASALAIIFFASPVCGQLRATPVCTTFNVDILEGRINDKLDCNSTGGEVQKIFPCFSSVVEETGGAGCGAVLYKDKGISFFTERDYVEITDQFTGKLEPALMGVNRTLLFKLLGNPKIKDAAWEAYQTKFGCLVLYFNAAGKINKIQISTRTIDTIKLCE
jgi:hypothetical protein